jgi:uncharacterized protein (TIGR03000 family)
VILAGISHGGGHGGGHGGFGHGGFGHGGFGHGDFGHGRFGYGGFGYGGFGYGGFGYGGYYPSYGYGGYYPSYDYGGYSPDYAAYYPADPGYSGYDGYSYSPNAVGPAGPTVTVSQSLYYAPAPAGDNMVRVHVRLPADALLWFDGAPTTRTGPERDFISPPLPTGKTYTYRGFAATEDLNRTALSLLGPRNWSHRQPVDHTTRKEQRRECFSRQACREDQWGTGVFRSGHPAWPFADGGSRLLLDLVVFQEDCPEFASAA